MFPLLHPRDTPRVRRPQAGGASVEPSSAPFSTIPHPLEAIVQPWITPSQLSLQSPPPTWATTVPLLKLTWSSVVRSPAPGRSEEEEEEESFPAPHHGNEGRLSIDSQ